MRDSSMRFYTQNIERRPFDPTIVSPFCRHRSTHPNVRTHSPISCPPDYPSHDSRAVEAEKQIERERAAFAEQQILAEQEMVGLVLGDHDREVISVIILRHSMGMPSLAANPRPNPLVPSV